MRFRERLGRWLMGIGADAVVKVRTVDHVHAALEFRTATRYASPETPYPSEEERALDPVAFLERRIPEVTHLDVKRQLGLPSAPGARTLWWLDPRVMEAYGTSEAPDDVDRQPREVEDIAEANLISSRLTSGLHAPVLDIDFHARLIPSSTPGHFHLYLDDLAITWPVYARLLLALADAGVIEHGYAAASIDREQTMVRKPGVSKLTPEEIAANAKAFTSERQSNPEAVAFVNGFLTGSCVRYATPEEPF
jgi:hypothetical protein